MHPFPKLRINTMKSKSSMVKFFQAALYFTMAWTLPSVIARADDRNSNSAADATPPVAKKIHTENHINDGDLVDDYRWLREKSNPEVAQYLESENAYTAAIMSPTEALQKKLYEEMLSHVKETDVNVPYKDGEYFYYSRW